MSLAIPLQATVIPVYLLIIKLGLYDTLAAIALPSIAFSIPLAVLVLSNFIRDVPKELFESMRVDGASEWRILWAMVLPLTKPALVTVGIYDALNVWNGFLFPLVLTSDLSAQPVTVVVAALNGQRIVPFTLLMACGVLAAAVPGIIAVVLNRFIIQGVTSGAVK